MCIQLIKNCIADLLHTFENLPMACKVVAMLFYHLTDFLI